MVVFTCGHCGESVQKPKVEKHYLTKCRNRNPNLSCMDCFKDFFGQDYESHIKCITEEERYSGKGFTAKEKKGEKKQTAWVEMLQSVLDEQRNAPANVLKIVETIIKLSALTTNGNQNKNKDSSDHDQATNGDAKEKSKNGEVNGNGVENDDKCESVNGKQESDETENAAGNPDKENIESGKVNDKKLSKKQRKEEKKRLKYEAELQSAEAPLATAEEEEGADAANKKGKKKKNRTESAAKDDDNNPTDSKNKHKKRKRQDTTSSAVEVAVIHLDNAETLPVTAEKTQKKKLKVDEIATEDSICLHDQNVAKSEEVEEVGIRNEKFDWHEVILSVLEKKGNELPFKRLQKKVLSEYTEMTGREVDDRIADKFIKKLKSAPKVKVDKNRVFLEE
ncbi:hypothetical protein evm_007103 [Chilo suppressalis]|nr:hypothetical protein evm_007103 [Chilo suppressalis]